MLLPEFNVVQKTDPSRRETRRPSAAGFEPYASIALIGKNKPMRHYAQIVPLVVLVVHNVC